MLNYRVIKDFNSPTRRYRAGGEFPASDAPPNLDALLALGVIADASVKPLAGVKLKILKESDE